MIDELSRTGKPFIILLNSTHPQDPETAALAGRLAEKYARPVTPVNVMTMSEADIEAMLESVLLEFPLQNVSIALPGWMTALPPEHSIMTDLVGRARGMMSELRVMRDIRLVPKAFETAEDLRAAEQLRVDLGTGTAAFRLTAEDSVFYRVLSEECGCKVENEAQLISSLKEFAAAKREYDRVRAALIAAEETGYGLVPPEIDAMQLDEPEIVQHGSRFGVRLKARASGLHVIRVDIESEVNPLVGTAEQSEELMSYLTEKFEKSPEDIWSTNIFGKSLYDLVKEGMAGKSCRLSAEVQQKLREAITRMVNEGCRGLVCIML